MPPDDRPPAPGPEDADPGGTEDPISRFAIIAFWAGTPQRVRELFLGITQEIAKLKIENDSLRLEIDRLKAKENATHAP